MSRPVHDDDGNPVLSQEAVAARDRLIETLGALPPVADAERLCSKLNARLGLDRDTWLNLAAQSMSDAARGPSSPVH